MWWIPCMNFVIFILSKYRDNLLAANHLILWERTKFDTEQKYSKLMLEIMTPVSSAYNIGSDIEFILRGRSFIYHISRPIRRTFFPEKCDLNLTCVLCTEGKYYFQTSKWPYIYYTRSLSWDSEICFQIMSSGITAGERLTFLSGDLP